MRTSNRHAVIELSASRTRSRGRRSASEEFERTRAEPPVADDVARRRNPGDAGLKSQRTPARRAVPATSSPAPCRSPRPSRPDDHGGVPAARPRRSTAVPSASQPTELAAESSVHGPRRSRAGAVDELAPMESRAGEAGRTRARAARCAHAEVDCGSRAVGATAALPKRPRRRGAAAADRRRAWDAMAEEIRMQVLQRIDLFTDTGLRDAAGCAPAADRRPRERRSRRDDQPARRRAAARLRRRGDRARDRELAPESLKARVATMSAADTRARLDLMSLADYLMSRSRRSASPYALRVRLLFLGEHQRAGATVDFQQQIQGFHDSGGPRRVARIFLHDSCATQ